MQASQLCPVLLSRDLVSCVVDLAFLILLSTPGQDLQVCAIMPTLKIGLIEAFGGRKKTGPQGKRRDDFQSRFQIDVISPEAAAATASPGQ